MVSQGLPGCRVQGGITNNPNRTADSTYIVRLIKKVVGVSVETEKIVGELSSNR